MTQTRVQTKVGLQNPGEPSKHRVVLEYDATVDSPTQGTTVPMRGDSIPPKAIVTDALLNVLAAFTSASNLATVAVQVEGANDVQTAALVNGAPWSTIKNARANSLIATAAPVTTTVDRQPSLVLAGGENLTAGRLRLILDYYLPDA